jgi:hypothetical protein
MLRERFQKWLTVNFPTRMQELPFLSSLPQEAQVVKALAPNWKWLCLRLYIISQFVIICFCILKIFLKKFNFLFYLN